MSSLTNCQLCQTLCFALYQNCQTFGVKELTLRIYIDPVTQSVDRLLVHGKNPC